MSATPTTPSAPALLQGLIWVRELQPHLRDLFPSDGSLEWEIRQRRAEYVAGGALFEIAGRLLAEPVAFRRVALEIGRKRLGERIGQTP